jgi:hypothetical protein
VLHVLEHEVEAAGHARGDEAVELDDVGVVEAAEDEDLAGHEADALRLEVVEAHLLERHDLAAHRVPRLVHVAVRALPDLRNPETCELFLLSSFAPVADIERRKANGNERARVRTLSIFSKESARRGVQPSMASPATAESQAGQPAATCSPRARLAKLLLPGPGAGRDERERFTFRAGFSTAAAGCSGLTADSWTATAAAGAGSGGGCGRSGLDAEGRPWTQPMGVGHRRRQRMERGGSEVGRARVRRTEEETELAVLRCGGFDSDADAFSGLSRCGCRDKKIRCI